MTNELSFEKILSLIDERKYIRHIVVHGLDKHSINIKEDIFNISVFKSLLKLNNLSDREDVVKTESLIKEILLDNSKDGLILFLEALIEIFEISDEIQSELNLRKILFSVSSDNIYNRLRIIELNHRLHLYTCNHIKEYSILEALFQESKKESSRKLVHNLTVNIFKYPCTDNIGILAKLIDLDFITYDLANKITDVVISTAYSSRHMNYAIEIIHVIQRVEHDKRKTLTFLPRLFLQARRYHEAVQSALQYLDKYAITKEEQLVGQSILLQCLTYSADWDRLYKVYNNYKKDLHKIILKQNISFKDSVYKLIISSISSFFYLEDNPQETKFILQEIIRLQAKKSHKKHNSYNYIENIIKPEATESRINIGYIASTLKQHSVGWLVRWLFRYHDSEKFKIHVYLINQKQDDPFYNSFIKPYIQVESFFNNTPDSIIKKIRSDNIQILVDLDSLTNDITTEVISQRSAPIQVSWLGWDSSGSTELDYFIADEYVVENIADSYYSEKIIRLKTPYVAVKGFEIGVPSIKRKDFEIPENSVIYMTCQSAQKFNPKIIDLQLEIIKQVRDSRLLIKGLSQNQSFIDYFKSEASKKCINESQIIFLPYDNDELTHRANLRLADIVLDTYPFNGATTTLEVLWAGIPIVTRAGRQFAARNSYTFMRHLGIDEGIAFTDEEYIHWGVRLGLDQDLREKIIQKLRKSKHSAALWDAKNFTRDLEQTYIDILTFQQYSRA